MTESELRTLRHIRDYRATNGGISPSLADLAFAAGLSGRSTAGEHVRALIASGHLIAAHGTRRGYLVSRGWIPSAAGLAALAASEADGSPSACPTCGQPVAGAAP